MFQQWALRPDSAGAGRHRGGFGAIYEIELLEEAAEAFLFGERGRFAPQGVAGGAEAARNRFTWGRDGVWEESPMTSKATGIRLVRGDRLRLDTPGGGYGDPARREPAAVARDVASGLLTPEAARAAHGSDWEAV